MDRFSKTVHSLLISSLGLPGMQELLAQEAPEDSVDYRYTHYDEEPLPLDKLAFGDPRRYEIDSHQFRLVKNLNQTWTLELDTEFFLLHAVQVQFCAVSIMCNFHRSISGRDTCCGCAAISLLQGMSELAPTRDLSPAPASM